jgi:amyloid beta precursor protein binding protein 1
MLYKACVKSLGPCGHRADSGQSISDFVGNSENLHPYTLILVTSPIDLFKTLEPLAKYAWDKSIPLFYLHSNGFYSHFSIQLPEQFPIVDTHPDPVTTEDLRLLSPWPELLEFMEKKTKDLGTMSDHDHGHIPYVLLLLYYLELWKGSHEGKYPGTYSEKSAFRATIKGGARINNSEGGEENFDEAVAAVLKSLNPPSISSGLRAVFDSPHCQTPSIKVCSFSPYSPLGFNSYLPSSS